MREQLARFPLLDAREEVSLAKRIERGDQEARDLLVVSNMRLVFAIAARFSRARLAFADRVQAGAVGLIEAVDAFDYRRGLRFSTVAWVVIGRSIQRAIDDDRGVQAGVSVVRLKKRRRARRELAEELGREPSTDEVGAKLGLSPTSSRLLEESLRVPVHIDSLAHGLESLAVPNPNKGADGFGPEGGPPGPEGATRSLTREVGQVVLDEPIVEVESQSTYEVDEVAALIEAYTTLYDARLVKPGRTLPVWLLIRLLDLDYALTRVPTDEYLVVYEHALIGHTVRETGRLIGVPHSTVAYRYRIAVKKLVRLLNRDDHAALKRLPLWRWDLEEDYWIEEPGQSKIRDAPYYVQIGRFRIRFAADVDTETAETVILTMTRWALDLALEARERRNARRAA